MSDPFFELIREGLVNALVHRDYDISGAKCQLVVAENVVTIKSPGGPPQPITIEQMQSFSAPMLSRNPVLHYVFAQMELAEERGLGMRSMKLGAQGAELPLPKYSWEDPYLTLTIYTTSAASLTALDEKVLQALSNAERMGWEWLAKRETATSAEYGAAMAVPNRTALNHLRHLAELGLVSKRGQARSTYYEVVRP